MEKLNALYVTVDTRITNWMARYGISFLRVSIGFIFFWFGVLKFFPGLSPAQDLASRTIQTLTFGLLGADLAIFILALWETVIGIGLILGVFMRGILFLLFLQMLGTLTPIVFFPNEVFAQIPIVPTLEGQYIVKNFVLISAGIVLGATVRGGRIIPDPRAAKMAEQASSS
jgi:uncharacterized membrane protein YphA (DoxX/SURF4 family)